MIRASSTRNARARPVGWAGGCKAATTILSPVTPPPVPPFVFPRRRGSQRRCVRRGRARRQEPAGRRRRPPGLDFACPRAAAPASTTLTVDILSVHSRLSPKEDRVFRRLRPREPWTRVLRLRATPATARPVQHGSRALIAGEQLGREPAVAVPSAPAARASRRGSPSRGCK